MPDRLTAAIMARGRRFAVGGLVAVVEAPGGRGASTATALSRGLVAHCGQGAVVLADLRLDGPHRALHGVGPVAGGLVELAAAARFGPPPADAVASALHRTADGYDLLPGLPHHHDWVSIGGRAAAAVIDALCGVRRLVVAHVDGDLEGEPDTGSFDVEDRNVLARTATATADLVVVVGDVDRAGRQAVLATLAALAAFGVAPSRVVVVGARRSYRSPAASARLGTTVLTALERGHEPPARPDSGPTPVAPGSLGGLR